VRGYDRIWIVGAVAASAAGILLAIALVVWLEWVLPSAAVTVAASILVTRRIRRKRSEPRARWRALRDLAAALWPLAIPTMIVLVYGSAHWPPAGQVIIGAIAGVFLAPLATQWKERSEHTISALLLGGVIGIVIALGLSFFVSRDFGDGGSVTLAATVGVGIWLVALLVRLAGFVTGVARGVFVAIVLVVIQGGLASVALVPGGDWAPCWLALLPVGAFVALVGAEAIRTARARPALDVWRARASRAGLVLSACSAALLVVAMVRVWGEAYDAPDPRFDSDLRPITAELPRVAPGDIRDRVRLAWQYVPMLEFDSDQKWTPRAVEEYMRRAALTSPGEPEVGPGNWTELPRGCPGRAAHETAEDARRAVAQRACHVLTVYCPKASLPCADARPGLGPGRDPDDVSYVRVVRRSDGFPWRDAGPYAARLDTLIQYWFFYPYDEWVAYALGGQLVQRHEADWEAVTVGLARDRPLFVGYSQHCGSASEAWDADLPVADTTEIAVGWEQDRDRRTHPLVGVALGSQANYPRARNARAVDWSSCEDIPGGATAMLSYLWNVRDRTGADVKWVPGDLRLIDGNDHPMHFPGLWGPTDSMRFESSWDEQPIYDGIGPATPTRQHLWKQPLEQIFCGKASHPKLEPCPT
jgi:hypothetical protein